MIQDIVIDLDDTAFATYHYFDQQLKSRGIDCQGHYITTVNGGPHFLELLDDAKFMRQLNLMPFVANTLDLLRDRGYRLTICTHRGYHADGRKETLISLEHHRIRHHFETIHVIDPKTHNNKLTYLREQFGHDKFILVDDKPVFDSAEPLASNVLLRTQFWNTHIDHPFRISSFERDEFFRTLNAMQLFLKMA
ncbi:hypothetical protein YOLOSWAG_204 [Erwinia phage vB_EamM_Yoloswag]|uniref:Uncharacterized protein n=1 Tax=Erwinia phage vB_EamM_Yoloswag TaxID=1958956 RepID=A0A1S6L3C8_9CAUD|nr:hypothetical protein HOR66_gp204 [Erwinia phage vB_EamM_Yoloswag]AQT28682.1 hypothetical protein YOLOSWAG_204 [Erwinia phage vB_EamM_Yoloswag]